MITPSHEQLSAIQSDARVLVVNAYAGCGKSFTLERIAESVPSARVLYLAYSKAIQLEASARFPSNVMCKTTHALARQSVGTTYVRAGKQRALGVRDLMKAFKVKAAFARVLLSTVNSFLQSGDCDFGVHHLPEGVQQQDKERAVAWGQLVWRAMVDVSRVDVPMPHDGYLKLYQLTKPDLSQSFDVILVDEWQDANPVTIALIEAQTQCKLVMVGDRYQSIFAFRGAVNAMEQVSAEEVVDLTETRRFGPGIAKLATLLLQTYRAAVKPLRSAAMDLPTSFTVDRSKPHAIIARTNARLFAEAAELSQGKRLHFVGGIESYPFQRVLDVWNFAYGNRDQVLDKRLLEFTSNEALKEFARDADDKEILSALAVAEKYGKRVPEIVEKIQAATVGAGDRPDVWLMTAHRSKGLEYDQVVLLDDFPDFVDGNGVPVTLDTEDLVQELHLFYVALTRAKLAIELNHQMTAVIRAVTGAADAWEFVGSGASVGGSSEDSNASCVESNIYKKRIDTCPVSISGIQCALTSGVAATRALQLRIAQAVLRTGAFHFDALCADSGMSRSQFSGVVAEMVREGTLALPFVRSCEPVMGLLAESIA